MYSLPSAGDAVIDEAPHLPVNCLCHPNIIANQSKSTQFSLFFSLHTLALVILHLDSTG